MVSLSGSAVADRLEAHCMQRTISCPWTSREVRTDGRCHLFTRPSHEADGIVSSHGHPYFFKAEILDDVDELLGHPGDRARRDSSPGFR